MKLTPKQFCKKYYIYAKKCEDETGISAIFTLAQAALESGWGEHAPGNNFFGIKAGKHVPNNQKQNLKTLEYINGKKVYVNVCFRKYADPGECFKDHSGIFFRVACYKSALKYKDDPYKFSDMIAKHYATSPNYASYLKNMCKIIERNL